jgi:hypothetical protein
MFPETSSVSDSFIAFSIQHFIEKSYSWNIPLLLLELTLPDNRGTQRMNDESVNTGHMDKQESSTAHPVDVWRCVSCICTRQRRGSLGAKTKLWSIDGFYDYDNLNSSRCGWHLWHLSAENETKGEITAWLKMCAILL